jgi:hypothetical protein
MASHGKWQTSYDLFTYRKAVLMLDRLKTNAEISAALNLYPAHVKEIRIIYNRYKSQNESGNNQ